jgi:hypothetical protein
VNYTLPQKRFGKTTVSFSCEICAEPLVAPLEDAGMQQPCPKCGNPFVTPGTKELQERQLTAAEKEQQAKRAAADQRARELAALEQLRAAQLPRDVAEAPAPPAPPPPAASPSTQTPRYSILNIAAYIIMALGILAAAGYIIVGIFAIVSSVLADPGRDPFARNLQTTMRASGITFGLLMIAAGVVTGIFAIAVAQLLLAVRDMAINSFHIRFAVARDIAR